MGRTAAALALAVIVSSGAAPVRPAAALQGRWEDQVAAQLDTAARILAGRGFTPRGKAVTGQLRARETDTLRLTLHAGTQYALLGVCDRDCAALDLRLFDATDREVDARVGAGDSPIVQAAPAATGEYRLVVIMGTCTANPCWYGIGIYGRKGR